MNSQRFTNIQFQFGTTGFLLNIYLLSESLSLTPSIFVFKGTTGSNSNRIFQKVLHFFSHCIDKTVHNSKNTAINGIHSLNTAQSCRSVTQSYLTLRPHGLQHPRLPCPSPTPGAYSNSCPLSQQCHPTISSSVIPFSSRLQSFLASGSFLVTQFFTSGGQIIRVSASASVLLMNIQD